MALTDTNGTQLQAVNTQGIDINKNHVGVNIDWIDAATNQYFDPTTTTVAITRNGVAVPQADIKVLTPLSRQDETVGVWVFEFLTTDMAAGTWIFTFTGSASGIATVTHTLTFTAAEIPVEQYFIGALRAKLADKRTSRYIIDDTMRTQWKSGELFSFLDDARLEIGQMPPEPMDFAYNFCYSECHTLLLTGGFIYALMARGILATHNKFTYTDELTLNIDRSIFFQNAASLRQQWVLSIKAWKRDYQFHKVRGIGMRSGKFPLYYTRVLSLLPNMARTFYA